MDIKLKYFIIGITFIFSLTLITNVYSITCCYDGNNIKPQFSSDTCNEGEINIGYNVNFPMCRYEHKKLCCAKGTIKYETVKGRTIYDFSEVKNYFKNELNFNLETECDNLVSADNTCQDNYENTGEVFTGNQNTDNNGVEPRDLDIEGYDPDEINIAETADMITCSSIGKPFGFFATPNECKNLTNDGDTYPCIYNPYLSGELRVSQSDTLDNGLSIFESGCMAKTLIDSCSDYKTRENCINNPVGNDEDYSHKSNLKNCEWVPTNDFYSHISTSIDSGICIANITQDSRDLNIEYYTDRMNLLKNPSFETSLIEWKNISSYINPNINSAYHGKNDLTIENGGYISQNISYLNFNKGYKALIHIKQNENFTSQDELTLTITEYYNNSQEQYNYYLNLGNFNNDNDIYKRGDFNEHIIQDENLKNINFKLYTNKKITIDAVDFELDDDEYLQVTNAKFKPVEIINPQASNCELCFNDNNLNFCTEKKSEILGDCSYMVQDNSEPYSEDNSETIPDFNKYLGVNDNKYLNNWSSQSIPNSLVFCEMYLYKDKCKDSDNYVNSKYSDYHPENGNTLCKWDNTYGCYKDSDNSNGPDTIQSGSPYLYKYKYNNNNLQTILDNNGGFNSNAFDSYNKTSSQANPSDYKYACDLLPPQNYIYFKGKNITADELKFTDDFPQSEKIGDIQIHIETSDIELPSCKDFNISKMIYLDYNVNDKAYYDYTGLSMAKYNMPLKEFLVDENKNTLLKDGENNITISIKDQSGNVGYEKEYELDADVNGPNITLNTDTSNILGPNSTLNFTIKDYTRVKSCNYKLNPIVGNVEDDYYNSSGDFFNLSQPSQTQSPYNYLFELPIYNTTAMMNVYKLQIECYDLFNQKSNITEYIFVDYNTDFILFKERGYEGYSLDLGFLNNETSMWAVSVEKDLKQCKYDFKSTNGTGYLNVTRKPSGFNISSYSNDMIFFSNITGTLDFSENGIKNISIICQDNIGNEITKDYQYYYDKEKPELLNYSLISEKNNILTIGNKSYIRKIESQDLDNTELDTKLNITLDGTYSWVSRENVSIKYLNKNNSILNINNNLEVENYNINENNYIANLIIKNYNNLQAYIGDKIENNLYKQDYILEFKDKAQNYNNENITIYYDDSNPKLVFNNMQKLDNTIYTNDANPLFNLTFNTPEYREFKCSITIPYQAGEYTKDYNYLNNLNFGLNDIITSGFTQIGENEIIDINFNCIDKYGYEINSNYKLKYDNTTPVLNDIYFKKSNSRYLFYGGDTYQLSDINDTLIYNLENTNEDLYKCNYSFNSNDYICNESQHQIEFNNPEDNDEFETNLINIVSDNKYNGICYRNRTNFNQKLNKAKDDGMNIYETSIRVKGICQDAVGLKTEKKTIDYELNYALSNKFIDFKIEYNTDEITFIAESLTPFNKVEIAYDSNNQNNIMSLNNEGRKNNGLYTYRGTKTIDNFGEITTPILIWAIGYWESEKIGDRISEEMIIDDEFPTLELNFPDADKENKIYSDNFEIGISAEDTGGSKLDKVELWLSEDQKIFSTNNISSNNILEIFPEDNYFSADNNEYIGKVFFKNATIGNTYNFKLKAYDGFGNMNEVIKEITIEKGVGIRLLDTENAKVSENKFSWITKDKSPNIKFRTSKQVEKCNVYPFSENKWNNIIEGENIASISSDTIFGVDVINNEYEIDLNQFEGFNLEKIEDKQTRIVIRCNYNSTIYKFNRTLEYVNKLPDYVLTSENGFEINQGNDDTKINIKSVGPNRYIKCNYTLGDNYPESLSQDYKTEFNKEIDFSTYPNSQLSLKINCFDKLGTKGPEKEYVFNINRNSSINITNLSLTYKNSKFIADKDNNIYINELTDLGLKFKTNTKDITCNYRITKSSGKVLESIINFVRNLFITRKKVSLSENNNFIFEKKDSLEFSSQNTNILEIVCTGNSNKEYTKKYKVRYLDEKKDFNISKITN